MFVSFLKKVTLFLLSFFVFLSVLIFFASICQGKSLGRLCPYGYDIDYRIYYPEISFCFSAKEFYFQEGRILFFRTRLIKKLVFEDVTISVFKKDEKLLEVKKEKLKLNPDFHKIVIPNPQVLYVKGNFFPKKVYIFPNKGEVKIVDKDGILHEL